MIEGILVLEKELSLIKRIIIRSIFWYEVHPLALIRVQFLYKSDPTLNSPALQVEENFTNSIRNNTRMCSPAF
jgi:hypothetical protein